MPKIVPGYAIPLGYEYSAPYRYDRVHEVLSAEEEVHASPTWSGCSRTTLSLPARELVPLLKNVTGRPIAGVQEARKRLLEWNFVLDRESVAGDDLRILGAQARAAGVRARECREAGARRASRQYDIRRVIALDEERRTRATDATRRRGPRSRCILAQALEEAVADLRKRFGDD